MNVRLAIQVLSESVGRHLYTYHGPECHGTADLCMMMDKFFDLLNIKNDIEHTTSIKEFLTPFTSPNDKRFKWLLNDFLSYFERWQESIEGTRNEHPSLYQFGYDSNMIRMSRSVVHVTGNSKGAPTKKEEIE